MKIGEASKHTGLSYHTLRYYEELGLIRNISRNEQGKRDYSMDDIKWILFLVSLKRTEIPLSEMVRYAELYYNGNHSIPQRIELLTNHKDRLFKQLGELQESIDFLNNKINFYMSKMKASSDVEGSCL